MMLVLVVGKHTAHRRSDAERGEYAGGQTRGIHLGGFAAAGKFVPCALVYPPSAVKECVSRV